MIPQPGPHGGVVDSRLRPPWAMLLKMLRTPPHVFPPETDWASRSAFGGPAQVVG